MSGSMHGRGACVAGETAIAAGGKHPTGMHYCFNLFRHLTHFLMCFKVQDFLPLQSYFLQVNPKLLQ